MSIEPNQEIDTYFKLADRAWQRNISRRGVELRIALATWGALLFGTSIALKADPGTIIQSEYCWGVLGAIITFALYAMWTRDIKIKWDSDRNISFYWESRVRKVLLELSLDDIDEQLKLTDEQLKQTGFIDAVRQHEIQQAESRNASVDPIPPAAIPANPPSIKAETNWFSLLGQKISEYIKPMWSDLPTLMHIVITGFLCLLFVLSLKSALSDQKIQSPQNKITIEGNFDDDSVNNFKTKP